MNMRRGGDVGHATDRYNEIKLVGPDVVKHHRRTGARCIRGRIFLRLVDGGSQFHHLGTGVEGKGANGAREKKSAEGGDIHIGEKGSCRAAGGGTQQNVTTWSGLRK